MTTEKAMIPIEQAILPTIQEITLSPKEIVEIATEQANALMDIVEKKKLYVEIQKKKYLFYEAWETIGQFNGVKAIPDWVTPIKDQEETIGYTAKVDLLDKCGRLVGSGIMPCYFDEAPCRGKEGSGKHKAAMSAAQTFAGSKAYRMNFAYIAVLGGYEPTPAEEMITEVRSKKDSPLVAKAKEHGAVEIPNFPKLNKKYPSFSLEICQEHGEPWVDGEYGRYHKMPKGNCYLRNQVRDMAMELVPKYLAFNSHEEPKARKDGKMVRYLTYEFKGWLKMDRQIEDWNKTDIEKQLEILESLITE